MTSKFQDMHVALLVCDGFEESELKDPKEFLEKQGVKVDIISPNEGKVKAWHQGTWSKEYAVNVKLDKANPQNYNAVILPGGVQNPDKLRTYAKAIEFIQHFFERKKPIAAICHGPWTLIETEKLKGRKLTSYHSIRTDLENAGAIWTNEAVVVDDNLITSREPKDIPAFNHAIVEMLSKIKPHH